MLDFQCFQTITCLTLDHFLTIKDIHVCVFVCYKSSAFLKFNFVVVVVEISQASFVCSIRVHFVNVISVFSDYYHQ